MSADRKRSVTRIYAVGCADLAQSTLAGLAPRSAEWISWFAGLRSAARELSPAQDNTQVAQRALFHGGRLGVRYREVEVNELLKPHHPYTATLRRELVGAGLLVREQSVYWRPQ